MSILIIIDSPTILILALPYIISQIAIKSKRNRVYVGIACFGFYLPVSSMLLSASLSLQYWVCFPFTLETFVILTAVQVLDLIMQIRSL